MTIRRLLIDECLSQALVAVAKDRGVLADHVVWLGKGGAQDWTLVPYALEHDYAFVTNNRRDFLRAYAQADIHDGLIIIVPMVVRAEQARLFGLALDAVLALPDTVNTLVQVFANGEIRIQPWFAGRFDASIIEEPAQPT